VVVGGVTSATFDFSTLPGADKIKDGAIIQANDILALSTALTTLDGRTNGTVPSTDTDLVNKGFLADYRTVSDSYSKTEVDTAITTSSANAKDDLGNHTATQDVNLNNHKITALAPATANTDAVTLEQVNGMVSAAGSTTASPGAVSNVSNLKTSVNWGEALYYCSELSEGGFDDWGMPTFDEITYARTGLKDTSWGIVNDSTYLWTRDSYEADNTSWYVFKPSDGSWDYNTNTSTRNVRCVR